MSTLIQNKATESHQAREMLLAYSDSMIAPDQFFYDQYYFTDISHATDNNKFTIWLRGNIWNWIISPSFLLCSILLYAFVPKKIFGDKFSAMVITIFNIYIKRFLDIICALSGIVLSFIFFLILPVMIKLDSKGPVFYMQVRVGQNRRKNNRRIVDTCITGNRRNGERRKENQYGKTFVIYKFRTMREDAEKKCGPIWASDNDPRITSLGRILRATHLDELPQLFNILKGDMSIVGPRPERPHFVNNFARVIPDYADRLTIKPGLTGLAQIKTGYDYSIESVKEKLTFDLEYCQNGNIGSYFKIIFLTLVKSVLGKVKI